MRRSGSNQKGMIVLIVLLIVALIYLFTYFYGQSNQTTEVIESSSSEMVETQESEETSIKEESETESSASSEEEASESESVLETSSEEESGPLFDESIVGDSEYPASTIPSDINKSDLKSAIDDYYASQYTNQEKENGQSRIAEENLDAIETALANNTSLSELSASVDQIQMKLADDTVYVARIIVPMTYTQANNIYDDNDIELLTVALTELGNRLVMISYYDESTQELTPYHLTNSTKPLFTYSSN